MESLQWEWVDFGLPSLLWQPDTEWVLKAFSRCEVDHDQIHNPRWFFFQWTTCVSFVLAHGQLDENRQISSQVKIPLWPATDPRVRDYRSIECDKNTHGHQDIKSAPPGHLPNVFESANSTSQTVPEIGYLIIGFIWVEHSSYGTWFTSVLFMRDQLWPSLQENGTRTERGKSIFRFLSKEV